MFFADFELKGFWKKDSKKQFVSEMPTDGEIIQHETRLGYKLPKAYIALTRKTQNGGLLQKDTFLIIDENGNIKKTLTCTCIYGIGADLESETERKQFPGLAKLPDIGIYFGANVDARRTERFVLDYSECGKTGEPKISFVQGRYNADYEVTIIAEDFERFVKKLSVAPKIPAFDFNSIKEALKDAVKAAFNEIINSHNGEIFNGFALYTDAIGSMIAPAVNTKEHFEKNITLYPKDEQFYKYATTEWKYEGTGGTILFEPINNMISQYTAKLNNEKKKQNFRNGIIELCITVLLELKTEEYFDSISKDYILMVNVSNDEIGKSKLKEIIKILNQ